MASGSVRLLGGVVKDHAQCMALPRAKLADAVPVLHPIIAAGPRDGPIAHCENHCIALFQRHHLGAGLPPRPLLGEDELPAGEMRWT